MTGKDFLSRMFNVFGPPKKGEHNKAFEEGMKGFIPVLNILTENGAQSAGQISEFMHISTARVAKILNGLEEKGFAIRKESDSDKRVTIVEATEVGRKFFEDFKKDKEDMLERALVGLTDEEIETFFRVAETISSNIKKEVKECV